MKTIQRWQILWTCTSRRKELSYHSKPLLLSELIPFLVEVDYQNLQATQAAKAGTDRLRSEAVTIVRATNQATVTSEYRDKTPLSTQEEALLVQANKLA
jgi:hypothetical protein